MLCDTSFVGKSRGVVLPLHMLLGNMLEELLVEFDSKRIV